MNRIATASIDLLTRPEVKAAAGDAIEISLDCSDCQRRGRTVFFKQGDNHGTCTPSGHWFRGLLLGRQERNDGGHFQAQYEVLYQYEPFIDAKYPDSLQYYGPSDGVPTWVRIHFTLACPSCKAVLSRSTQTNLVRPCTEVCECGYVLFADESPPDLSWRKEEPT